MKLVSTKIPANTIKTIPKVPGMTPVKYKTAINKARMIRIVLSVEPIFFFIAVDFKIFPANVPSMNGNQCD